MYAISAFVLVKTANDPMITNVIMATTTPQPPELNKYYFLKLSPFFTSVDVRERKYLLSK